MRKFIKNNWLVLISLLPWVANASAQSKTPTIYVIGLPMYRTETPPVMAILPAPTPQVYAIAPYRPNGIPEVFLLSWPFVLFVNVLVHLIVGLIWYQKNRITFSFFHYFKSKTFLLTFIIAVILTLFTLIYLSSNWDNAGFIYKTYQVFADIFI